MKAAVLYKNGDLRYDEFPTPEVKPGTAKVRVRAAGICGSDVPRVLHNGAHFYPIVLGHEFSGDVVEVGDGVASLRAGDTVAGVPLVPCGKYADCLSGRYSQCKSYTFIGSREQGAFAEYVVLPEKNAVKYDPKIPYEYSAMFEPSTVALHALRCNDYRGGGDVAVLGCGSIGIFTVQWARIFGAKCIAAFDIDDGRLELAKRVGADFTVNTKAEDADSRAKEMTGGKGFKYVFSAAGDPATIHIAFSIATKNGDICCIGTPTREISFTPSEWEQMNRKEFRLTGSWMSYSPPYPGEEWTLTAHCLASGQLKMYQDFIYRKYPLSQAAEAFREFTHPENVHGKIMLINEL